MAKTIDLGLVTGARDGGNADTLNGKDAKYYTHPRNLLDNSDFRNPVNQRGQTSYSGNGYTIDRWRTWADAAALTVNSGYITIQDSLFQYVSGEPDKVYTYAVCKQNGEILVYSGTPQETFGLWGTMWVIWTSELVRVQVQNGDYLWAALYEGEYTADNLPPYVPKGYAAELAECQRYFERIGYAAEETGLPRASMLIAVGTSGEMRMLQGYRVPKRIAPTVLIDGKTTGETVALRDSLTGETCTGAVELWNNKFNDRLNTITIQGGTSVVSHTYEAYIDVIADL